MWRIGLGIILAVSVTFAPLAAGAQPATKVPRVGILIAGSSPGQSYLSAFRQGLHELGYVEGQSIAIEYRWAEGKPERLLDLATELVRLKVDVIVAHGGVPPAQATQRATKEIPIFFTGPADPSGGRTRRQPRAAGRQYHRASPDLGPTGWGKNWSC